jgi:hypothetical protein
VAATSTSIITAPPVHERPLGLRERRRERRRLIEQDRRAAARAELYVVRRLLYSALDLVESGWAQDCWFTVSDGRGGRRRIGPQNLHELGGQPVADVCLVGGIVQAGGGVARAGSQPVHRALDLTWATLYNQPTRWCPSPALRLAHIRDLTRWNDAPRRTPDDVTGLLAASALRAGQ